jgi:twitching motility two-component system response regulator PilH
MSINKVLIVDDSETELVNLKNIVSATGAVVLLARSGSEGVQKAKAEQPDLILMDIVMDEVDGYAACRAIKKDPATSTIPVVFVSSKHQKADRLWAAKQGGEDLITKPYTQDQIVEKLKAFN